jgi:transposase
MAAGIALYIFCKTKAMKAQPPKKRMEQKQQVVEMAMMHPDAAGIDVGSTIHVVAVPPGRDEQRTRTFGTLTCDLQQIAAHLKNHRVSTVAMESTGVYWKALFAILVQNGFEVVLANATQTHNVSGRKTDEEDAVWIQKLHSCGLLKSSYLPDEEQEALRTLVRFRKTLTEDYSRCILRMQKSLELMNIKIAGIIDDITGKTGTKIIEAILEGERDPVNFLPFIDRRIKADKETIVKSLQGNWRAEHLFTLRSSYELLGFYKERVSKCDEQIEQHLQCYEARQNEGIVAPVEEKAEEKVEGAVAVQSSKKKSKKKNKNSPAIDIRKYLQGIHGVDVMEIYGISDMSGLQILGETGTDLSKWENEKHFCSWLNLCPNIKKTGGKVVSSKLMRKKPNLASQAFRNAANSVQRSDHWLGDYFRRMKSKGGNKYAVVATARKIACIYYKIVRYKEAFKPVDLQQYQQQYKQAKIAYLERKLEQLKNEAA